MRRATTIAATLATAALAVGGAARAGTGVDTWRLNEVVATSPSGDPAARYVELYTAAGGCWFPSTRLDAYDAAGHALGSIAPFASTTCFGADTYVVMGTTAAAAAYAFTPDVAMAPPLPAAAGQLCFASTATNYDCVRWGAVTAPVHAFVAATDDTSAVAPPAGVALARVAEVHVVATDWAGQAPTPRGPNDGSPWTPPDAGPPADAAVDARPDGGPPDAVVDARPPADAGRLADARDERYLDLDPGGGACTCAGGGGPGGLTLVAAAIAIALAPRRRRNSARPRARGPRGPRGC